MSRDGYGGIDQASLGSDLGGERAEVGRFGRRSRQFRLGWVKVPESRGFVGCHVAGGLATSPGAHRGCLVYPNYHEPLWVQFRFSCAGQGGGMLSLVDVLLLVAVVLAAFGG